MNLIEAILEMVVTYAIILILWFIVVIIIYKIAIFRMNRKFDRRAKLMRKQFERQIKLMEENLPVKYGNHKPGNLR